MGNIWKRGKQRSQQNLVVSFGSLQVADFSTVRFLVIPCGNILSKKKKRSVSSSRDQGWIVRTSLLFLAILNISYCGVYGGRIWES